MAGMKTEEMIKDLDVITEMKRRWKSHLSKQDRGSYCEDSSVEYSISLAVLKPLDAAQKALQRYEDDH